MPGIRCKISVMLQSVQTCYGVSHAKSCAQAVLAIQLISDNYLVKWACANLILKNLLEVENHFQTALCKIFNNSQVKIACNNISLLTKSYVVTTS